MEIIAKGYHIYFFESLFNNVKDKMQIWKDIKTIE